MLSHGCPIHLNLIRWKQGPESNRRIPAHEAGVLPLNYPAMEFLSVFEVALKEEIGNMGMNKKGKATRGFSSMEPQRQREIASAGGKAVPDKKRSFSRDRALAAEAGRKGGQAVRAEQRSFFRDRALAAQAGRKGGATKPNPE